jgi:RNase P subunit RPR2
MNSTERIYCPRCKTRTQHDVSIRKGCWREYLDTICLKCGHIEGYGPSKPHNGKEKDNE